MKRAVPFPEVRWSCESTSRSVWYVWTGYKCHFVWRLCERQNASDDVN